MSTITANHIFFKFNMGDLRILWLFKFLVILTHYTNSKNVVMFAINRLSYSRYSVYKTPVGGLNVYLYIQIIKSILHEVTWELYHVRFKPLIRFMSSSYCIMFLWPFWLLVTLPEYKAQWQFINFFLCVINRHEYICEMRNDEYWHKVSWPFIFSHADRSHTSIVLSHKGIDLYWLSIKLFHRFCFMPN